MRTVIIGCGRTGAVLAETFESLGHDVTVLDTNIRAFDRLPATFRGSTVRGDGTDEDVLRRAGAADADLLLALTEGDNRNIMAGQLATEVLGVKQVIIKINDPVRADAYAALGTATICRTNLMEDAILSFIGESARHLTGVRAPTGTHPGGEHHEIGAAAPGSEG